ncbi:type II toxin-antitoxin system VapC family toxin [Candidatus Parcubacteria bacterium]|nr:type II toxin-antitoxin system VapC family toxin [Candidatus Parcubacteria bacterium]MBI4385579.1 type II toxin-antitoxin system VapC family toxin [Candidatus Parcubacteria bacterium]
MTIDANVIIAYLGGEKDVIRTIQAWRGEGRALFLSTVAETEVLSFSEWTLEERHETEQFLEENFTPVVFDRPIARIAADIRRNRKLKFPDAAIAATALCTRSPLVTRNLRDFKRVHSLSLLKI